MARGDAEDERKLIPVGAPAAEAGAAIDAPDDKAAKEAQQLNSGAAIKDLKRDAEENEHRRNQQFRDHFEWLSIRALDALFIGFFVLATILVLHIILPAEQGSAGFALWFHCWLRDDQLDDIKGILAGGIIAGLVADHFKRRMG